MFDSSGRLQLRHAVTTLSQWLAAEEPDLTEPAGYYIPGAEEWDDISRRMVRGKKLKRIRQEMEAVYMELLEEED